MWRRLLVAALTGCLSISLSIGGFIAVRAWEQDRLRTAFGRNAKDSLSVLKGRRVGWDPATVPRQPMGAPSTVEPRHPACAPASRNRYGLVQCYHEVRR